MLRSPAPPQPGRQRCRAVCACAVPGWRGLGMRPGPRSRRAAPLIRHWPRESRRGASPGGGHPRLLHPMAHRRPTRPGTALHHRAPPPPHDLPVALRAHPLRHRTGYAVRRRWARARLCPQHAVGLSVGLRGWAGLPAGSCRHDGEGQQQRRAMLAAVRTWLARVHSRRLICQYSTPWLAAAPMPEVPAGRPEPTSACTAPRTASTGRCAAGQAERSCWSRQRHPGCSQVRPQAGHSRRRRRRRRADRKRTLGTVALPVQARAPRESGGCPRSAVEGTLRRAGQVPNVSDISTLNHVFICL